MTKKIKAVTAKDNIYWEELTGCEDELICCKGHIYPVYNTVGGAVYFLNEDGNEHRWNINELEEDFIIEYVSDDKSLCTFTQNKPLKPKRPLENWIQTISPKKFERCVEDCTELDEGIFYNEDTNCVYLHYNPMKGYTVNDDSGLPTRINFTHKPEAFKKMLNIIEINKTWRSTVESFENRDSIDNLKESVKELHFPVKSEWTDAHYDFTYKLTQKDLENGFIKLDPYFVAKEWKIGSKDDSGALFHSFKLFPRWAEKNSFEREVIALYKQTKRMAEIYNIDLGED